MYYYFVFIRLAREMTGLIICKVYIVIFVLSLWLKNITISITYANYTGGTYESMMFLLMLIWIMLSHAPDSEFTEIMFKTSAWVKNAIGFFLFKQILIGNSLWFMLLCNPLFKIKINSLYTNKLKISQPIEPNWTELLLIQENIPYNW